MKYLFFILFPLFCFGQTITLSDSDIRAFYGAAGHGKDALGGRGDNIYQVTNTDNSGAGSFRQAIADANTNGGGVIIFRVGGTITLSEYIPISVDNLTIAGQTAPGDGIQFTSTGSNFVAGRGLLQFNGSDIVVRHIRVRQASSVAIDNFRFYGSSTVKTDVIFDHISSSHSEDGNWDCNWINGITVMNSLFSQSLGSGHMLFIADGVQNRTTNVTAYRNVFQGNMRMPRVQEYAKAEFINNYAYGYSGTGNPSQVSVGAWFDAIGNYYEGPNITTSTRIYDLASGGSAPQSSIQTWFDDNLSDGSSAVIDPVLLAEEELSRNLPSEITAIAASSVYTTLIDSVGAGVGTAQGLDSFDASVISTIKAKGTFSADTDKSEIPTMTGGTPYADSDGDGLSDEYEIANGGGTTGISPNTRPSSATLVNGTTIDQSGVTNFATAGYTHMDIFLGELAGDWTGGSGGSGGGSSTPDSKKNGTSAMLIAH